jgi:O-antigen/teichoic acid export membrane protein
MKSSFMLLSLLLANILNFLFNAYLGRVLSFESFGLVTLMNTIWYIALVPITALLTTVNHRVAYLTAAKNRQAGVHFLVVTRRKSFFITLALSGIWLLLIPAIDDFFQINNILIPLFFTPAIILGALLAANKGFLQGNFYFKLFAGIIIFEGVSKLLFAWFFVTLGMSFWAYLAIPLSILVGCLLSFLPTNMPAQKDTYRFPQKFFTGSLIVGFSSMAFLTVDVLLAKHFLSPEAAGQYALLSLIGKMVFFFAALPNTLMITYVSRDRGLKKNPYKSFYLGFGSTLILALGAFVAVGIFGEYIAPILFGDKTQVILPYLLQYAGAIALFSLSASIISFHLAHERYLFPYLAIGIAGIMSIGIIMFHETISQMSQVIFYSSLLSIISIGGLHLRLIYKNT